MVNVTVVSGAILHCCFVCCFIIEVVKTHILFIILSIGGVIGSRLRKVNINIPQSNTFVIALKSGDKPRITNKQSMHVRRAQHKTSKEIACELLIEFYDDHHYHFTFKNNKLKVEFAKNNVSINKFSTKVGIKYNGVINIPGLLSCESFAGPLGAQTIECHSTSGGSVGALSDSSINITPSSTAILSGVSSITNRVDGGVFNSYGAQLRGEGAVYTGQKTEILFINCKNQWVCNSRNNFLVLTLVFQWCLSTVAILAFLIFIFLLGWCFLL